MRVVAKSLMILGTLGISACAVQPPTGPQVVAMPGPGKSLDQFQGDDERCRVSGAQAAGPLTPSEGANQSGVGSAVAGTALGAAAGALLGSTGGAVGAGAAIGAGAGLLAGSAVGANAAQESGASIQRVYDVAYVQCMSAAGEKVPDLTAQYAGYPGYSAYPVYGVYPAYGYGYSYPTPFFGYGPSIFIGGEYGRYHHWR